MFRSSSVIPRHWATRVCCHCHWQQSAASHARSASGNVVPAARVAPSRRGSLTLSQRRVAASRRREVSKLAEP
jgi:hypothetical protein